MPAAIAQPFHPLTHHLILHASFPATDAYNWCPVEDRGWDVILFAGIATVIACLSQGPYSSLIVLIAGEKICCTLHACKLTAQRRPLEAHLHKYLRSAAVIGCVLGPAFAKGTMRQLVG